MSDEGYTLPDTLSALAILSLAMGGVLAGGLLLTKVQGRTDVLIARSTGLKRASVVLENLVGAAGPFRSTDDDFSGAPDAFAFECGAVQCGARLEAAGDGTLLSVTPPSGVEGTIRLKGFTGARFAYVGDHDAGPVWPRATAKPERLRQLLILQGDQSPLAEVRMVVDQPLNCEFDVVSQDCR